ncbi:hypothetical protein PIB30_030797 [Stylosanthes scabra]|uniref:Uncharacterized protein n=1 Tax=Stylosanthes scabra TaxID=79078 RepID=A0ABU6QBK1_9FABA|nr:hypothetical protein [Stylosanthes scabra]
MPRKVRYYHQPILDYGNSAYVIPAVHSWSHVRIKEEGCVRPSIANIKTKSNLHDMYQKRYCTKARLLPGSNALYGSSTVSNEQGPLHRLDMIHDRAQWRRLIHVADPT